MKIFTLFLLFTASVALAQPSKPGTLTTAKVVYTITVDNMTITTNDHQEVTVQEAGKKPVRLGLTWFDPYQILNPDLSILAIGTKEKSGEFTLTAGGVPDKMLATITPTGEAKLPGRAKPLYFNAKGELANSARKVTIAPAAPGKKAETLAVLVAVLHAKL